MKIYLFDLKPIRKVITLILVISLSVAATSVMIFAFDEYAYPVIAASANRQKIDTVIIDAGHGGEDCGAIGSDGVYEKDLNLAISALLKAELEKQGYKVIMTRTEDKMLYSEDENVKGMRKLSDLKNRCKIAQGQDSAIFVSIHMNSFGAERYSGLQVYYSDGSDASRALAQSVQSRVKADIQPENERVVKNGKDLYILDNCPVTAIIVECGFLSNNEECKKLSDKEYQKRLSLAMVCGIIDYIEAN